MSRRSRKLMLMVLLLPGLSLAASPLPDPWSPMGMAPSKGEARGAGALDASAPEQEEASSDQPLGMTPDLVYAVLVAYIANQRGNQELAYTHFLHGARLALDPDLAAVKLHGGVGKDVQAGRPFGRHHGLIDNRVA